MAVPDGTWQPVDVVYQVTGISQTETHAYWATSFAVLVNYRDGSNLTPADVSNAVGADLDAVESWSDVIDAASHFGLHESTSACMDVRGWAQLLADYGPLWICVHSGSHAVVLTGVRGDGTPEGTTFYLADPWNSSTTDANGLLAMFDAIDAPEPGDRLIVWHG
jgi:ABC-type bacteriocin/lantibiotic exporter with double-glycine peptidase domain